MLLPYHYEPLEPESIRLLRILDASDPDQPICSLQHQPHGSVKYTALSYCWGDPTPVARIKTNDKRIDIATNLWSFLKSWSKGQVYIPAHADLLWIDAICINQKDAKEKSVQIQQMWRIYEDASLVVGWLGTGNKSTSMALRILKGLDTCVARRPLHGRTTTHRLTASMLKSWILGKLSGKERSYERVCQDLIDLSHNDYFARAWTYQEIQSARDLILCCGSDWCYLNDIVLLYDVDGMDALPSGSISGNAHGLVLERVRQSTFQSDDITESTARTLDVVLTAMLGRKCADPRDRIFASLNVPSMRAIGSLLNLQMDYMLTTNELFVLCLSRFDCYIAKEDGIPSDIILSEFVFKLASAVDIRPDSEAFVSWLLGRLQKSEEDKNFIELYDGQKVDCSGEVLSDLVGKDSNPKKYLEFFFDPPDYASANPHHFDLDIDIDPDREGCEWVKI